MEQPTVNRDLVTERPLLDEETLGRLVDGTLDPITRERVLGVLLVSDADLGFLADTVCALGLERTSRRGPCAGPDPESRSESHDTVGDGGYTDGSGQRPDERTPARGRRAGAGVHGGDSGIRRHDSG